MSINVSYLKQNPFPYDDFSLAEFQKNILRWVVLAGGLPCIFILLFEQNQWMILLCLTTVVVVDWLLDKILYLAGAILFLGFSTLLIGLAVMDQAPIAILLLSFLPMVFGICFGIVGGGLSVGVLIAAVVLISTRLPNIILAQYTNPVIFGSVILVGFGLVFRYWMVSLISFYYENYHRAARELNEAREQRVELKQVQEDLTHANKELAHLAKQLKVLNQVAEEARMAKENFVAMVSHELRTPLNMIIGFSEVITQSPAVYGSRLPPALLADIASIQRNSQHLLELVNDVLDLSQVDMGNLAISREWCSIHEIVIEACEVIKPLFQSKGLFLKKEMPDRGSEQDKNIYCDKTRVREIIINLLSNAGRFTEQGGVSVRAHFDGNHLVIAVEDTGPGIALENQAKIFEPFQQLDSSIRRRYGGSGLGLAISKRFVEMHGGKMWLESELGRGTTFFFSLPVGSGEGEDIVSAVSRWINPNAIRDPRVRSFKASLEKPKPRCIILEEGQTIQHLFNRYLDSFETLSVHQIDEAVETATQLPSQLLIINDPQAVKLLNSTISQGRLPFEMPVMAFWMPGGKEFSDIIGANQYLMKPVNKDLLLKTIGKFGEQVKRILLVDDNPEVIQLFARVLSSADNGYQVLRASSGGQALDLLRSRKPDLMILDLIMPEMNGFQVLEEKARDAEIRDIPVVVITAQDPAGLPKISQSVTITQEGGFSSRDLLQLIEALMFQHETAGQVVLPGN